MLKLVWLCLFWSGWAQAAVFEVPATAERLPLGSAMEYFFDETGRLDLQAASRDSRYRPALHDSLSFGYGAPVLWVRLALHNPAAALIDAILQVEPERLERVSLFLPGPDGGYLRLDNGLRVAVAQRPLPARGLAFPLRLEPGRTLHLFFRVETRNALSFMPVLRAAAAFERNTHHEELLAMLNFGVLLGLAGFAVLLFPLQRDRTALFLGCSMVCYCLFEAAFDGYGYAYLWPNSPDWALRAPWIFVLLMQAAFNRFVKVFLRIESSDRPWAARWLNGLLAAKFVLVAGHLFGVSFVLLAPIGLVVVAVSLLSHVGFAVAALVSGYRPVRYLVLGQAITCTAAAMRIGEVSGWLPITALSSEAMTSGLFYLAELCFFAAVSRRVDLLQTERESARAAALAVQRDISARLESEVAERTSELHQAKELAERANRSKGEFLARVSHELRSPLHTILSYAALLRRDFGGKAGERLALLEDGGRHLLSLIEDLLAYARHERDTLVLAPEPVFLHRLLARLDDHGAALAAKRMNHYQSRHGENLPPAVRVDARRLEQAVLVLLSNAARYTRRGTLVLEVTAQPAAPDRVSLRFAVADSGIGIAAADLARIFQPFERAAGAGGGDGLGLGLAIARQIVQAMGGEIAVESQPGVGSRFGFTLELPLAAQDEVPVKFATTTVQGYEGPTRRILVLDDTAAHRLLLEHLLSDLGFEVRGVSTLRAAREQLAVEDFDLALLDQCLPDGSAWDLLSELSPGLPAILISAMPPAPPPGLAAALRFEAVLLKPLVSDELLDAMGRVLGLRWVETEVETADGEDVVGGV